MLCELSVTHNILSYISIDTLVILQVCLYYGYTVCYMIHVISIKLRKYGLSRCMWVYECLFRWA